MRGGVVGCGYWGPNLVRNFLGQESLTGMSCFDLDTRRVDALVKTFPNVKPCRSYDELLDNSDFIAVATPVHTHYQLALQALEAGKHVLVEKPMTLLSQESANLRKLADSKGLVLMVDHTFIYTPAVQKMKELLGNGQLGRALYFDSVRVNLGLFQSDVNVIWDLAPHDLSILLYLFDERPIALQAQGRDSFINGVHDLAYLTLFYADGFMANLHLSWLSPTKVRKITVAGDKRMIVYDDMESSEKVKVYDKGVERIDTEELHNEVRVQYRIGDIYTPALKNEEALRKETAHFLDCIENGTRPMTDGVSGEWVVKILEAANQSLKNGERVELEDE